MMDQNVAYKANRLKLMNFFACAMVASSAARVIELTQDPNFPLAPIDFRDEAIVALVFVIVSIFILGFVTWKQGLDYKTKEYLYFFLMLLWIVAVITFTFHQPFSVADNFLANGFFGSWIGFLSSLLLWSNARNLKTFDPKALNKERKYLVVLVVASVPIIIQAIQAIASNAFSTEIAGFALAVGALTLVAATALYFLDDADLERYICILLWLLCLSGALITTILGPFLGITNGYVAVWANTAASTYLLALKVSGIPNA